MTLPEQAALTFVVLVFSFGVGILGWCLWVGFWSIYDRRMQRNRRIKNRIDMSVGRDCFRDIKGIHR